MKKLILLSLLLSLSLSVNAQETEEKNVASFDLDNGLKFYLMKVPINLILVDLFSQHLQVLILKMFLELIMLKMPF
jgi:hypothetical protein